MSKKKKWKNKSFKKTYSEKETLLEKMHALTKAGRFEEKDQVTAYSLMQWHLRRNGLTPSQWDYASVIIARAEAILNSKHADRKQYLYGISDGGMIKLGMSCNPTARIKELQTSNPNELNIIWKYYTGKCVKTARSLEKKLHRRCKKYKERGEWFSMNCFHLVKTFRGQDEKKLEDNDIFLIK